MASCPRARQYSAYRTVFVDLLAGPGAIRRPIRPDHGARHDNHFGRVEDGGGCRAFESGRLSWQLAVDHRGKMEGQQWFCGASEDVERSAGSRVDLKQIRPVLSEHEVGGRQALNVEGFGCGFDRLRHLHFGGIGQRGRLCGAAITP